MTIFVNLPRSTVNSGPMVSKKDASLCESSSLLGFAYDPAKPPFYASRLRRNAEGFSSVAGKRKTVSLLLREGQSNAPTPGQVEFSAD